MENREKEIDLSWFNDKNIDFVDNQMEIYMPNLLDIDNYIQLNQDMQKLELELNSSLSENQLNILRNYQRIDLQITSYQNSLAYYLGLGDSKKQK